MLGIHILVLESFPSRFLVSSIRHSLFYYLYIYGRTDIDIKKGQFGLTFERKI